MKALSLLNNKGIALLSVMGIAGVIAVMIFAMTLMATNINKINKGNLIKSQVNSLRDNLLRIIHDQVLCGHLFQGLVFNQTNTGLQGVNALPPMSVVSTEITGFTTSYGRLQVNAQIGNDLRVNSMAMQVSYTSSTSGPAIATPFLLPGPGLSALAASNSVYQDDSGTLTPISVSLMIQLQNLAVLPIVTTATRPAPKAFGPPYFNISIPNIHLNLRTSTSPSVVDSCIPPSFASGNNQNTINQNVIYNTGWSSSTNDCEPVQSNLNGINCSPGLYVVSVTPSIVSSVSRLTISSYQCCRVNP